MGRIISDITRRDLIVEGMDEVKRLKEINKDNEYLSSLEILDKDIYKVSLISRVGSFKEPELLDLYKDLNFKKEKAKLNVKCEICGEIIYSQKCKKGFLTYFKLARKIYFHVFKKHEHINMSGIKFEKVIEE